MERLQAKLELARRSPTMRSSASTGGTSFSQSPSTPPGCDVMYGEPGISKTIVSLVESAALVFLLIMRIEIQWNSLFPLSISVRHNPSSIEKYFDKLAASYMARIPKAVLHEAPTPPTVVCTSMILYQINCCFTVD